MSLQSFADWKPTPILIVSQFSDGQTVRCSGGFWRDNFILTAGHCIADASVVSVFLIREAGLNFVGKIEASGFATHSSFPKEKLLQYLTGKKKFSWNDLGADGGVILIKGLKRSGLQTQLPKSAIQRISRFEALDFRVDESIQTSDENFAFEASQFEKLLVSNLTSPILSGQSGTVSYDSSGNPTGILIASLESQSTCGSVYFNCRAPVGKEKAFFLNFHAAEKHLNYLAQTLLEIFDL